MITCAQYNRLENAYFPTLTKNWGLFSKPASPRHSRFRRVAQLTALPLAVPVQLANFSVVPAHLRLLLVNIVSLGWNTYLSAANSATAKEDEKEELVEAAVPFAK